MNHCRYSALILSDPPRSGRLMRCRHWFLWFRHSPGHTQAVNCVRIEPKIFENFVVMLTKFWSAPCRYFGHAMYLNWTADRRSQLAASAFERDHYVVGLQLRIFDDLLRTTH